MQCQLYSGSICQGFLGYTNIIVNINGKSAQYVENSLSASGLSTLKTLSGLNPDCIPKLIALTCMQSFPECGSNVTPIVPCKTFCTETASKCSAMLTRFGQADKIPKCTENIPSLNIPFSEDATECNVFPYKPRPTKTTTAAAVVSTHTDTSTNGTESSATSTSPWTITTTATTTSPTDPISMPLIQPICPEPLVYLQTPVNNSLAYNIGPCYFPCPMMDNLYEAGIFDRYLIASRVLNWLGILSTTFLSLSFTFLPSKKDPSAATLRYVIYCTTLGTYKEFFLLGGPRNLQCVDSVTPSTQSNNVGCAAQGRSRKFKYSSLGILVLFSGYGILTWHMWLGFNLMLRLVFRIEWLEHRKWVMHLGTWPIAIGICILSLALNAVGHQTMGICSLTDQFIDRLFFFPLTAVLSVSFICFIITSGYILWAVKPASPNMNNILKRSSRNGQTPRAASHLKSKVQSFWKLQWRTLIWLAAILTSFLSSFGLYFSRIRGIRPEDPSTHPWISDWMQCIFDPIHNNKGQNICAAGIAENLVSPFSVFYFELVMALFPLLTCCIFLPNNSIISGWFEVFLGQQHPRTIQARSFSLWSRITWLSASQTQLSMHSQGTGGNSLSGRNTRTSKMQDTKTSTDSTHKVDVDTSSYA